MTAGLIVAAAGCLAMPPVDVASSHWALAPAFVLAGSGIALTAPSVMAAALTGTDAGRAAGGGPASALACGSGVLNAARQVGGAIGMALFGSILGTSAGDRFVGGMRISIALAVGAPIAAAAVAAFCLPRRAPTAGE